MPFHEVSNLNRITTMLTNFLRAIGILPTPAPRAPHHAVRTAQNNHTSRNTQTTVVPHKPKNPRMGTDLIAVIGFHDTAFPISLPAEPWGDNLTTRVTTLPTRKHANADALIAFHSGRLAAETDADVLIASGDGALASDVAHSIAESLPARLVFTLGFPGAVSARLNDATNNGIAGNLLLGMDCLRPANRNDL